MTTIADQLGLMRRGEVSAAELAEQALASAERNAHLGAWELVDADGLRAAARTADRRRRDGDDAPLLGVPVAVKDIIDVAGLPTRAGSAAWSRSPSRDARAVAALRAAGAAVMGKTFTVEWAYGIDGLNPHRPPCLNPRAHDRLPGGSSSGSAAVLAAGTVAGALGTDTSGSVRVPAAFCGVVGLRPTFGAVATDGVVPLAPSYDVVGPMATTVADVALMLAVLTGRGDEVAAPWRGAPPRIGVVESLLEPAVCDPGIAATVRAFVERLEHRGARVEAVAIPGLERAVALHRTIQLREAADVHGALGTDPASVATPVRERLAAGAALDAATVAEARRERARLAIAIDAALGTRDALLAPGATMPPPLRSVADQAVAAAGAAAAISGTSVPLRDALQAAPVPFTQHGGPAVVLPAGTADGLPVGVQLVGGRGRDRSLLALAAAYVEEAPAWVSSARSSPGSVTGRRQAKPSQR
jgi:aspartyl-tRNA(Asn)/glutamyl-tRNA(Gln) amidotransferase subunit A